MFFREFPTVSLLPVRHHDACELWGKIDVSNRQAPPALYDDTAGRASVAYSGTYLATAAHQVRILPPPPIKSPEETPPVINPKPEPVRQRNLCPT